MLWVLSVMSIAVGTVKNSLSRSLGSRDQNGVHHVNTVSMSVATVCLLFYAFFLNQLRIPSLFTFLFALIYAFFSLLSQISLIKAMAVGSVSFSSLMFSCGFIPSTLLGVLFFRERITYIQIISVIVLAVAVGFSMNQKSGEKLFSPQWFFYAFTAFICAGLLGFLQKYYQKSKYSSELPMMLFIDFFICAAVSVFLFRKTVLNVNKCDAQKGVILRCGFLGAAMAFQNINNIYLAGKLPSVIFFPLLNGGIIICTTVAASLFFRERLSVAQKIGLCVAVAAMVTIGISYI